MPASKNIFGPDPSRGATLVRPAKVTAPVASPYWYGTCADPNDPNQTKITADFLNDVSGALREAVATSGATQSEVAAESDVMLAEGMARYASGGVFGVGGGTANAQTVAAHGIFVVPKAYFHGMIVAWSVAAANTGAATLNPFALGVKTVYDENGNALTGGELDGVAMGFYDSTLGGGAGGIKLFPWGNALNRKRVLPASVSQLTLYVRTDGNDANDGSANSAAKAFATIAGALTYAKRYDLNGKSLKIKLGLAGTYAIATLIDQTTFSGSSLVIEGDTAAQASYVLTSYVAFSKVNVSLAGLTINNAVSMGATILYLLSGASVDITNVTLSYTGTGLANHIAAQFTSTLTINGGCIISGSAFAAVNLSTGSTATLLANLTVSGTPAFSNCFCRATQCSVWRSSGVTISGAATGTRYNADLNGVLSTSGGGANFFPGSVAGTTSLGGQYQ